MKKEFLQAKHTARRASMLSGLNKSAKSADNGQTDFSTGLSV